VCSRDHHSDDEILLLQNHPDCHATELQTVSPEILKKYPENPK
jgi:hypothetical protein